MKYRWVLPLATPEILHALTRDLAVSPLLARCLANRGLTTPAPAARFLDPRLRQLADPARLPGMDQAVARLWTAREAGEPVTIFGDYDVDGVSSTALLLEVLRTLGWRVNAFLPHRLDEGYGLTREAVENCLQQHPTRLLLAVDCGSTAVDTIRWLSTFQVDVLVLDHHQVATPPPAATAVVNPQLGPEGADGERELCSVGLAFKLAHALVRRARDAGLEAARHYDLRPLLDLVALGTIADLVPLTGQNRILVSAGLQRLNPPTRTGLDALRQVAQVNGAIGPFEVAFQLGPRLNAAGRLEHAAQALELLLTRDPDRARTLALALDAQNTERQNIERNIADDVIHAIRARFNPEQDYVIVEGQLLWHVGVVGIVASRVLQEFYRPTLILGGDGHEWRGSGRSIEGFDLAAALRTCSDLLVRHGGHAMAAGLTIDPRHLPALRTRLNQLARQTLHPDQLQPSLHLDAEVSLTQLDEPAVLELDRLQPAGQGNPAVRVAVPNLRLHRAPQRMGREQQHVKFRVTDGQRVLEAVWWGGGDKPWPAGRFDLAGVPQINDYQDRRSVQLKVLDWRPSPQPTTPS